MGIEFTAADTDSIKHLMAEGVENLTVIEGLSNSMRNSPVFNMTLDAQNGAIIHHAKECLEYLKEMDAILQKYYAKI